MNTNSPDERGVTLIELLIYMLLLGLILAIGGGLLIGSFGTTTMVQGMTESTNFGQLLQDSVQRGVRNAVAVPRLVSPPTAQTDGVAGTQLLVVETLTGDTNPKKVCQAWLYVPVAGGQLFLRSAPPSEGSIAIPSLSYLQSNPERVVAPRGWSTYGENVKPVSAGGVPFATDGSKNSVSFSFIASNPDTKVSLKGRATPRNPTLGGTSSCFP